MEQFGLFFITLISMILVPGPDMIFVVGRVLSHGPRGAYLTSLGIALGYLALTLCVAFGLQSLLANFPDVFLAIKYLGLAYITYLAYKLWRSDVHTFAISPHSNASSLQNIRHGFVGALLNPKGLIFYSAILPQFHVQGSLAFWQYALIAGVLTCLTCFVLYSIIGLVVLRAHTHFIEKTDYHLLINRVAALLLFAVMAYIIYTS